MNAGANYEPTPTPQSLHREPQVPRFPMGSTAIDVDELSVKQWFAELQHSQRSEESFQRQLQALEHLLLTLRSLALIDDLTQLYNRRGFLRAGAQLLNMLNHGRQRALLFYIDVDNLKTVNDSLGHAAGDTLLTRTSHVLRQVFRTSDIIGRLGGDEFAVLAPQADLSDCTVLLTRLSESVDTSNSSHQDPTLSLSAGFIEVDPGHLIAIHELLQEADKAMYQKKLAKLRPTLSV